MGQLSRKTILTAIDLMEGWRGVDIDTFFYGHGVEEYVAKGSKKDRLFSVFLGLERDGKEGKLRGILLDVLSRLQGLERNELRQALIRDGFVATSSALAEDVPIAEETRSSLEILVARHSQDFDVATLNHHLRENMDLFRQEKWDSSVSHARNFVEQLLADIGKAVAARRNESPAMPRPVQVRQYLQHVGFFDKTEREKLVDGVYGFFSEEGSHPGISTQSAARVCMHVLWAFGFYVLEKFENWKSDTP